MGEKYSGLIGRFHLWKEGAKEKWNDVKEEGGVADTLNKKKDEIKDKIITSINHGDEEYDHLYRKKSRWELTRISAAVMGIEFSYAAETAFVSPTLLKIGVQHEHMTMIWCLSPLIGFFLTPIMGSLSDRCGSKLGRRRPFIILLSLGVVLGLILVPNGKWLGKQLGDRYPGEEALEKWKLEQENQYSLEDDELEYFDDYESGPGGRFFGVGQEDEETKIWKKINMHQIQSNSSLAQTLGLPIAEHHQKHPWGVFFTVLGTVLLDFDADSCQSPSRAYLLDVTLPDDHAVGLSTFTIMAGLGGSLGYAMGAFNWGWLAVLFGGHVRLVFTLVLVIFVICVLATLTSFAELPLNILANSRDEILKKRRRSSHYNQFKQEDTDAIAMQKPKSSDYGSFPESSNPVKEEHHVKGNPFVKEQKNPIFDNGIDSMEEDANMYLQVTETSFSQACPTPMEEGEEGAKAHMATFGQYLWSIVYMPSSLRVLCLTNLFCWMSLVCYSLYFTDFVGEAVFGGDPQAEAGSEKRRLYDKGVQFGCWGMAMAKPVYIGGQLVYCIGMIFMALTQSKWGVLVFSWSAGVMYSTLFTMPYLLVAHYHETDPTYSQETKNDKEQVRGIGTDVGIVSCMVFLAQFILSLTMGQIIAAYKSTVAVIIAASVLSFCGAVTANFVTYLDL